MFQLKAIYCTFYILDLHVHNTKQDIANTYLKQDYVLGKVFLRKKKKKKRITSGRRAGTMAVDDFSPSLKNI